MTLKNSSTLNIYLIILNCVWSMVVSSCQTHGHYMIFTEDTLKMWRTARKYSLEHMCWLRYLALVEKYIIERRNHAHWRLTCCSRNMLVLLWQHFMNYILNKNMKSNEIMSSLRSKCITCINSCFLTIYYNLIIMYLKCRKRNDSMFISFFN